jgi:Short chain fatty acids transporter
MRVAGKLELLFRRYLPSPFAIALLLTAFAIGLAFWYEAPQSGEEVLFLLEKWYEGLWQSSLLVFMLQMILILVLGHTLALSPVVNAFIDQLLSVTRTAARATAAVCFFTLLVALFNWGLGLIFGAVMARKTAEKLQREGQAFSYALLGAAGYSGLMVWHGGLSGSAPLKAAEMGHLPDLVGADLSTALLNQIPTRLSLDETILGAMNRNVTWVLLFVLPLLAYFLARKKHESSSLPTSQNPSG